MYTQIILHQLCKMPCRQCSSWHSTLACAQHVPAVLLLLAACKSQSWFVFTYNAPVPLSIWHNLVSEFCLNQPLCYRCTKPTHLIVLCEPIAVRRPSGTGIKRTRAICQVNDVGASSIKVSCFSHHCTLSPATTAALAVMKYMHDKIICKFR